MKALKIIILVLGIVLILALLGACIFGVLMCGTGAKVIEEKTSKTMKKSGSKEEILKLEVLDDHEAKEDEFGEVHVTGTVRNNSDQDFSFVTVKAKLYAADKKTVVADGLDPISKIDAGEQVTFDILIFPPEGKEWTVYSVYVE